jgi:phosphoribosylformylglycinamidine synthase
MVGLLPDADKRVTMGFKNEGDYIYLVGDGKPTLGGSEYLAVVHGQEVGKPPALDMEAEKKLQEFLRDAIDQGLLQSAHDVSDGGLAVALAECCIAGGNGAFLYRQIDAEQLFGEANSRIVVSISPKEEGRFRRLAADAGVVVDGKGYVQGQLLHIASPDADEAAISLRLPVEVLRAAYEGAILAAMSAGAETA